MKLRAAVALAAGKPLEVLDVTNLCTAIRSAQGAGAEIATRPFQPVTGRVGREPRLAAHVVEPMSPGLSTGTWTGRSKSTP
jgi:hypothetical protein